MFYYTHSNDDVESSAVHEVYYNANDGEAVVVLEGGNAYQYSRLTKGDFEELSEGVSPGTYYATKVKRNNGPGKSLGYVVSKTYFRDVKDRFKPVVTAATPKALVETPNTVNTENITIHVGTPVRSTLGKYDVDAAPVGVKNKHAVSFVVDGGNNVSVYNVEAGSVNEAIELLQQATAALGLNVNVKEVTVYFE